MQSMQDKAVDRARVNRIRKSVSTKRVSVFVKAEHTVENDANLEWDALRDVVADEEDDFGADDEFARMYRAACKIQHFWLKRQLVKRQIVLPPTSSKLLAPPQPALAAEAAEDDKSQGASSDSDDD